ncbi:MAG TPA: PxKF domain-containing protein [Motilibacteraceae bacterium]|nr:PxKF domain-containing protein [Motilibacteraceae bacterium]
MRCTLRRSRSVMALAAVALAAGGLTVPVASAAHASDTTQPADQTPANLVANGGFEQGGSAGSSYTVFTTAEQGLPKWTVVSGSVETDASPSPWVAAEGSRSANLDGNEPGAMEQTVSDTVGSTYHLRFAAAVHSCGPATASFTVSWHGSVVDTVTVTRASLPSGGGPYDPKWTYFDYDVVGHGNDALRFTSLSPSGSCGPILDDVSLTARTAALTGVSLTATPADTPPGAQQVPTAGVPFDQVPGSALAAVAAAPLRSVPLRSVPLRSVPLRSVPLRSVDLSSSPLRSVTLNQVPLLGSLTWADILAGTTLAAVPLQNVTLDQVLSLSPDPAALNGSTADGELTLDQVDLQSSPLRSVSLASVYLGGVALGDLPTATDDGAPTGQTLYQAVCATADCTALKLSSSSPLLAADLAGVPLRSVPLRSVPLRSVPIGAPLRSVPLRSVPLRSVPLRSVRLGGVGGLDIPAATNLAAIPLSALSPTSVLLTSVQYSAVAQALGLGACATVCETLGDAVVAGVAAKVTLGDLATKTDAIAQLTLGDVGPFDASGALSALTIGDIADAFPATFSLADALFSLIDPDSVPWEQLPFDALALPEHDADGATVSYTASFTVSGGGGPLDATATVVLPPGYELAGAASGLPAAAAEPTVTGTVASGQTLVWTVRGLVPGTSAAAVSFTFRVRPGLVLGQGTATLQVQTSVPTPGSPASAQAQVTVVDDGATSVGDAPVVGKSTLVVGHTSSPDRITYLKVPVPAAGTRVTFLLSHLPIDADLVVYGPPVSHSPDASLLRSVPLRSVPLPDPGVDASGAPSATALLQGDVPLLTGYPLAGFGAQRGTGDEEVDTLSSGGGGYYTVQVTGYDGAASPQPWMFRVAETTPVETTCPARSWPTQTGSASGLPEIAGGIRSLFLVNAQQLRAEYGDQQTSDLLSELTTFAERSDVAGVVVQVDQDDDVAAAYNAWNAHPCSIEAANAVAGQVAQLVRDYRDAQLKITHDARQTISSVTLVGGDEQLPMARLADLTSAVNERGFAQSDLNLDGSDNPFTAAQKAGYLLSDDPYGTLRTVPWLDRQLYVPELGIGRLVETPAQIEGQLKQFVASGGVVDPASSLTTGYDFLSDGAQAVDAALAPTVSRRRTLISETWTRADLLGDLLPKRGNGPSIASVNAHFDQSRALPAAGNTSGDESDLVTTADLAAAPGALAGRLLFSMGCHAALSVPAQYSGIAGAPETADWAKELATQRALWVGNTGYGLGDSATVALSEALMRNFAKRLDGHLLAGAALSYAKQDYLGSLGAYGAADEKALQEIAFYGLPMWRIGGPRSDGQQDVQPPAPAAPATVPVTGVDGGLSVHDDVTTPTFQRTNLPSGASFWSVAGETQATAGQPVQPRTSRPAAAGSSAGTAKGVLVTSLSSHDVPGVTPQVARAVLDDAGNEPAPTSATAAFPSGVATLSTFATPSGDDTRLVLLPGQFIPTKGGKGVQRLFDSVGTRVFYGTGDDYRLPTFSRLRAAADDSGTVTFTVDVAAPDDRPVRQVLVLARVGGGAGTWQPVDLTHGTGTTWTGTLPGVTGPFEWFAQAVAPSGTVAVSADQRALSTVGYAFGGFQAPIHPLAVNRVKAGSAVPVTFVLRTQDGPVSDPSAVVSISSATSASCACPARGATTDSMTVSDPLSSLRLDRATGRFTYVWKTDRSWSGQCRVLTVALDDGTSHQVLFQLR